MTIFDVKGCQMTKISRTFFKGKRVPNTVFKFFPRKIPYWLNESQKTGFGGALPLYWWFYWLIVSKNNRVHPWMDTHQTCDFHENQFITATCITSHHFCPVSASSKLAWPMWNLWWSHRTLWYHTMQEVSQLTQRALVHLNLCFPGTLSESPHVTSPNSLSTFTWSKGQ